MKTTTIIRRCLAGAVGLPLLAAVQACGGPPAGTPAAQPAAPTVSAPSSPRATATTGAPSATATGRSAKPTVPASSQTDPFGSDATAWVAQRAGTVTAAVYDVTTGQTWTFGSSKPQAEASVVKLNILEALYAQHDSGLSESDTSLTREMMEDSDNDAATTLWYEAGGPSRIASFNTSAGLTHTEPSSCVQCPDFPWPGWGLSTTTPTDQLALMRELIKPSTLLTSAERDSALQLMENVAPSQRWGVSGGVPDEATVALKDGWLPLNSANTDWQINSVGWVSGSGRNYLMAVLTTGNPSEQYGVDTIDQLGTLVWQHLG
ncbi:MAG TPA: serine hydrolase [Streptosporangiaceae bacterium]|nr:serine hydrolase [Streptosporangiaceae bacterium]